MKTLKEIQRKLAAYGFYTGKIDGIAGPKTKAAVEGFQRLNGLKVDGDPGPNTQAALWSEPLPIRDYVPPFEAHPAAKVWPRQKDVPTVFGQHGNPRATAGKVILPIRFRIAWDTDKTVGSYVCHELVAEPMTRIWQYAVEHYGEDQFRRIGLDLFGGCFNDRKMRGGSNYSMHSYGIAYDVDPVRNQLKWGRDKARLDDAVYDPFWRIVEGTGAVSLGRVANYDWMHFQFARL